MSFRTFKPSRLANVIEAIGDWDIPSGKVAKALTIKHPPGTTICLIAQYRTPLQADWTFGSTRRPCTRHHLAATQVHNGVVSIRPQGPFGAMVVSLKIEAAARILNAPLEDFVGKEVDLKNIFKENDVILLQELLAEATTSADRVAHIEQFLHARLHREAPPTATHLAAMYLREQPAISMKQLASKLDISMRHLSRNFRKTFGTSPKRYARITRIERVLALRFRGETWADIAYGSGFADQAHMIRDFQDIVGQSPDDLFRPPTGGERLVRDERFTGPDIVFGPAVSSTLPVSHGAVSQV